MKPRPGSFLLLFVAFACQLMSARAQAPAGPAPSAPRAAQVRLLFSGPQDVTDTWGKLHFGVTPVRLIREIEPPPFTVVGCFPQAVGAWDVFGQQLTPVGRGRESYEETNAWKLLRATTRDGVSFAHPETVLDSPPGTWTQHAAMAYNPEAQEYLLLKLKVDSYGFAYTAFFSPDGRRWQAHPGNPLFYEGDAMSLFWSPKLKRFVCVSKSLQPHRKHIRDHGGPTKALGDDALRDRRVLMLRSSPDGRRWEPSVSLPDVWDRHSQKGAHPPGFLTMPDAEDPPDLEFYSGNAFWYHDRAYMMVLNYAASPLAARKHAPHLDDEWWTSPDGLRWERPARGVNALDVFPQIPRLETHPMIAHGMILFPRGKLLLGLPEDRLSFVGARANGEFSTRAFKMPAAGLLLNAAVPSPDRPFAKEQAYIMAAVLDEKGAVIPGFGADRCVVRDADRQAMPLQWGEASARQLAGRTVRLRFWLRSANIYAVTTPVEP
ncbi:MAG TPA: hypothetical protein PKM43_00925 [Verrucomicrobiota bacterium]|nr:hypothetical protein [Verrucomicrobiota bacterium]HRZ36318.1 hypothetical protein [Candidatus Paceibacterota bacterium]HRZ55609.1 hypothetical protein [Candidatus Paceibacterota bacterium]